MDVLKINDFLTKKDLAKYRITQIKENYFSGKFKTFSEMSNISKELRGQLSASFDYMSVKEMKLIDSKSSHKVALKLKDESIIESVLMEYRGWNTVCVSTQVGCAMGCQFCATGKMGFKRDLTAEEIVDQIIYWKQQNYKVNRVVFMGMGEAFLNWENVLRAIMTIHDEIGIGWRKMSISTVGIIEGINKLAETGLEINLAISLHSTKQEIREKIMPATSKYKLVDLYRSIRNYIAKTKRQVFFEYALMDGINDSNEDAVDLVEFIGSNHLFYLNIIILNPIEGGSIKASSRDRRNKFLAILDRYNTAYSQRMSLGRDIEAACGQLTK